MKAMIVPTYGGPDVLQCVELPMPVPGSGELLVRVSRTLATPPDCAFRAADPFIVRFFAGLTKPRVPILGDLFSGVVHAVGDGVSRFHPGDRVFGTLAPRTGSYAEYLVVQETGAVQRTPARLSDAEAVAVADGYMTAITFIRDASRASPGMTILVNGASGAIGAAGVQLAKYYGAEVIGVCSARNLELVASLGADRVIDYEREDFTAARGMYDIVFDAVGRSSFSASAPTLKDGGKYLTTVPSFGIARRMLRQALVGPGRGGKIGKLLTTGLRPIASQVADLAFLLQLIDQRAIKPIIDRTYPLEELAEAHRFVESGRKVGSVVIAVGECFGPR